MNTRRYPGGVSAALEARIQELESRLDTLESTNGDSKNYGIVKLSNATDVTKNSGLAVPTSELNATIEGSLANKISMVKSELGPFKLQYADKIPDHSIDSTFSIQLETYASYLLVTSQLSGLYHSNGLYMIVASIYVPKIYPIVAENNSESPLITLSTTGELSFTPKAQAGFFYNIYRIL